MVVTRKGSRLSIQPVTKAEFEIVDPPRAIAPLTAVDRRSRTNNARHRSARATVPAMAARFVYARSRHLVPFDGTFRVRRAPTRPPHSLKDARANEQALADAIQAMRKLQSRLLANDRRALLVVFQALDAAGKDGTIKAVMSGINPAGCEVHSFKKPSEDELNHDFLWRISHHLPERGRIGIFNRSHYEEVLVVKVHPEILDAQRLPEVPPARKLWNERYKSIRDFEKHLARNGTTILKFFLNVSKDEQRRRLLDRIDDPEANWKFQPQDSAGAKELRAIPRRLRRRPA